MDFRKHVKIRKEKFGSVIFDTLKEKVFVTNRAGSDILALLEEGRTAEQIVTTLTAKYDSVPDQIKQDVAEFLNGLKLNNILAADVV